MLNREKKEKFRKHVGAIVERYRLEKGMSRKELGELLGYEGNSAVQVVARFESGRAGIPKAKIDDLIQILHIQNSDFGLDENKSLKSFIASGGFLGTVGIPWGNIFLNMMEKNEAEEIRNAISEEFEVTNEENGYYKDYANLFRMATIYRVDSKIQEHDVLAIVNFLYDITAGQEKIFIDLCISLKLDASLAYERLEQEIVKKMKKTVSKTKPK